jgi:DNA-binding NarL/FixJ family response regulator
MIKILIVDDHAIVREGLKQIVAEENDMIVSGEAEDTSELFNLLKNNHFDIAVIDISMPGRSGLDALKD